MRSLAVLVALGLTGCSYTSSYVPPDDGRARVVWDQKQAVAAIPSLNPTCNGLVLMQSAVPSPPRDPMAPAIGYWHPPPDADDDLDDEPGGGGHLDVTVGGNLGPGGRLHGGHHGGHGSGAGHGGGGHGGGFHAGRVGGGHGGGGGGGGHGDMGKGAIAVLVLAYAIIPTVTAVWSATRPEETDVAKGIDQVNVFNDLVRSGDPACAEPRR